MDYQKFFKLSQRPFKPTLEAKFFYRGAVFENLCDLLAEPFLPPLLILQGQEGSGKSTFVKRLPKAIAGRARMAPVLDPTASFADVLRQALTFLGLGFKCPPSARDEELLGFFQNAVNESINEGVGFVLAIDDADRLEPETLADLLTLSRLEPSWDGRFCLALAGPSGPGRAHRTEPPPWLPGDVAEGAVTVELRPLSLQETIDYVRSRLKAAGATREPFTGEALTTLRNLSHGLPMAINALAEKSLMAAWAAGKGLVTNAHVLQAKVNLDNAVTIDDQAAKGAAGSERLHHRISGRSWLSLMAAALIVGAMVWLLWPSPKGQNTASAEAGPQPAEEAAPLPPGPQATPSAEPAEDGSLGLPSIPPSIVRLPQTGVALVVENGQKMARLWQGGSSGPGLKAEIAAPDFKDPGLYLVGRPRSRSPIIFRYPPKTEIPKSSAAALWSRVDNLLPQDILPLMVGPGRDLAKPVPPSSLPKLQGFLDRWVSAQSGKKANEMADLYAENFTFFEPGRKPVAISRQNLRMTLESEAQSAGEITLATSEPLIMLDPRDHNRAWIFFTLKYDSKLRHNIGLRTLILENGGSKEWSIVAELWLKEETVKN
ncbi:MAG: hypothetical protein LBF58_05585 [Deltaproteobacteria bacterium]|jgi:general secretion pathway protein A|nr:hypothetical protein [Deltaproteobacteria bacterium]